METMTLEQMYYIGELIAAVAVIMSLVYVAKEVNQNTNVLKLNNSSEFIRWNTGMAESIATQREVGETWLKGETDFDSLDEVDKRRMILFEWRAISAWNHYFHLHQNNLIEEHLWKELLWVFENIGRRQSVKESWKFFKSAYDEPYQNFMGQYLE